MIKSANMQGLLMAYDSMSKEAGLGSWLGRQAGKVVNGAKSLYHGAKDVANGAYDAAAGAADWAGNQFQQMGDNIADSAGRAAQWVGDQAGRAADYAGRQVSRAGQWVGDQAGRVANTVGAAANDIGSGVRDAARMAYNTGKGVYDRGAAAVNALAGNQAASNSYAGKADAAFNRAGNIMNANRNFTVDDAWRSGGAQAARNWSTSGAAANNAWQRGGEQAARNWIDNTNRHDAAAAQRESASNAAIDRAMGGLNSASRGLTGMGAGMAQIARPAADAIGAASAWGYNQARQFGNDFSQSYNNTAR